MEEGLGCVCFIRANRMRLLDPVGDVLQHIASSLGSFQLDHRHDLPLRYDRRVFQRILDRRLRDHRRPQHHRADLLEELVYCGSPIYLAVWVHHKQR